MFLGEWGKTHFWSARFPAFSPRWIIIPFVVVQLRVRINWCLDWWRKIPSLKVPVNAKRKESVKKGKTKLWIGWPILPSKACFLSNELKIINEESNKFNAQMEPEIQKLCERDYMLEEKFASFEERLASFEERLSNMERRNTPITVRKAVHILERCICLESAGSKNEVLYKALQYRQD